MTSRRRLSCRRRRRLLGAGARSAASALAALPEAADRRRAPTTQPPLLPPTGRPYNPVVTLNGWTLPWRMNNGVEGVPPGRRAGRARDRARHEGATCGATTASRPGPTIEVVEGDRVRIFVTNRLPEHTTIHWHGQRLPNGMDGVGGLTSRRSRPGKTYVYEFVARRPAPSCTTRTPTR